MLVLVDSRVKIALANTSAKLSAQHISLKQATIFNDKRYTAQRLLKFCDGFDSRLPLIALDTLLGETAGLKSLAHVAVLCGSLKLLFHDLT